MNINLISERAKVSTRIFAALQRTRRSGAAWDECYHGRTSRGVQFSWAPEALKRTYMARKAEHSLRHALAAL